MSLLGYLPVTPKNKFEDLELALRKLELKVTALTVQVAKLQTSIEKLATSIINVEASVNKLEHTPRLWPVNDYEHCQSTPRRS